MTDIEYVRIKDPTSGDEFTYDTAKVAALGLGDHVISKPALGRNGRPAPAKPRMPLGTPRPGSAADKRRTKNSTSGDRDGQSAVNTKEK